jgi:hypothetical protein
MGLNELLRGGFSRRQVAQLLDTFAAKDAGGGGGIGGVAIGKLDWSRVATLDENYGGMGLSNSSMHWTFTNAYANDGRPSPSMAVKATSQGFEPVAAGWYTMRLAVDVGWVGSFVPSFVLLQMGAWYDNQKFSIPVLPAGSVPGQFYPGITGQYNLGPFYSPGYSSANGYNTGCTLNWKAPTGTLAVDGGPTSGTTDSFPTFDVRIAKVG